MEETSEIIGKDKERSKRILLKNKIKCKLPSTKADETIKVTDEIGYFTVLKIVIPDTVHKSIVQEVKTNIRNIEEPKKCSMEIARKEKSKVCFEDISIQETVLQEVRVTSRAIENTFLHHTMMFGLEKVFAKVLGGISFKIASEAYNVIREVIHGEDEEVKTSNVK